jgi:hypothetical protein
VEGTGTYLAMSWRCRCLAVVSFVPLQSFVLDERRE